METPSISAAAAGRIDLGHGIIINRLGFGAMRITGPGVWGAPTDRNEVMRTLRLLPELGVDFIDTADSYGPDVSEQLIREALHPYGTLKVATKAGLTRGDDGRWGNDGRPERLIEQALRSRDKLGVERITLWQIHRLDPSVPQDEQFAAARQLQMEGVIDLVGLSEVGIKEIEAARRYVDVATVQNRYNVADRAGEHVLEYCAREGIAFIPWFPLAAGELAQTGSALEKVAAERGVSASQIAIAWLLHRNPFILPIPGTSRSDHLRQNVAAADIELSVDELLALEAVGDAI